jgi:hypothetical protein
MWLIKICGRWNISEFGMESRESTVRVGTSWYVVLGGQNKKNCVIFEKEELTQALEIIILYLSVVQLLVWCDIQGVRLKSGPYFNISNLLRFTICYTTQLTCIYNKCWKWRPFTSMHLSTRVTMFLATFLSVLSFTSSTERVIFIFKILNFSRNFVYSEHKTSFQNNFPK